MSRSFADLGVSGRVREALARREITTPFPIQAMVLPDAMAGRDVLARSRTGSGKTLAFAVPIVERADPKAAKPSALVLVPTRELASQVAEEFEDIARAKGLRVAAVYGGVSLPEQARIAARAHILVATPGRLEDLSQRRLISLAGVRILVLDEADRMLDMGFQPQVDRIVRRIPDERQTMFFSATLDGAVGFLARAYTTDPALHQVVSPKQTVDEVEHKFVAVQGTDKVGALADMLREEDGPVLIFVRTRRGASRLVDRLRARGVTAACLSGDMSQAARERSLARFESGKVSALVATDVAARGLDLEGISHVVNYDPPDDDKGYVHRVGRTARAGKSGVGVTFVLPDQQADVSRMASRLQLHEEFTQEGMKIAPPRVIYRSRGGRKSLLAGRPRRTA
jgi:superfamily II DNA/RNA helicase